MEKKREEWFKTGDQSTTVDVNDKLFPSIDGETTKQQRIEEAFKFIDELILEGYPFTNRQMDIGIKLSWSRLLPENKQRWFQKIAEEILKRPWAQVLWGQFRRNDDHGLANAPFFDPSWPSRIDLTEIKKEETCVICGTVFTPINYGQTLCGNKCGAEKEKRDKVEKAA